MPAEGVPFTVLLTISDPKGEQPVFNDMRQMLNALGVRIEDIRTAARVTNQKSQTVEGVSCLPPNNFRSNAIEIRSSLDYCTVAGKSEPR